MEQVLERVFAPTFFNILDYNASSACLFVEAPTPIPSTTMALVEVKKSLGIPFHFCPSSPLALNPIANDKIKHRIVFCIA